MVFYLSGMMIYFDNYSHGAFLYTALHGTYGIFWYFKDLVFPDPSFRRLCTLSSWLMPFPIALIPYSLPGYWMMSRSEGAIQFPSAERTFVAVLLFVYGIVLVMLTDAQKYLLLKERKGLITHGMNGWSRNMNYFGEMMLYASFGVLVTRWEVALIYSYMWGVVFYLKMAIKDY